MIFTLILHQKVLQLLLFYHLHGLFSIDLLFLQLFFAVKLIYRQEWLPLLLIAFVWKALLQESFSLQHFFTFHGTPLLTHVEQCLQLPMIFIFLLVIWLFLLLVELLLNFTYCLIQFLFFHKSEPQDDVFLPLMQFVELLKLLLPHQLLLLNAQLLLKHVSIHLLLLFPIFVSQLTK